MLDVLAPGVQIARGRGGRELSNEEIRAAQEAGRRAVAPLLEARGRMLRAWNPTAPLTQAQMRGVMSQALGVAREAEKNLIATIDKVPSHWERLVRDGGSLARLSQAIQEAGAFEAMIEQAKVPTVVPGFRAWIDHLLSRSEDAAIAIAYVENILPDWLRMRAAISALHNLATGIIAGIVGLAGVVASTASSLPAIGKIAIAAAGVAVLGFAIASGSKK